MSVVPLVAHDQAAVQRGLLRAVLRACPRLNVPLAAEIAGLRRSVAWQQIGLSALSGGIAGLDPGPSFDGALLVELQADLVRRIGALHGYRGAAQGRQVALTMAAGAALRLVSRTASRALPAAGWLASGLVGAAATWIVGRAAMAYYGPELPATRRWIGQQWEAVRGRLPAPRR